MAIAFKAAVNSGSGTSLNTGTSFALASFNCAVDDTIVVGVMCGSSTDITSVSDTIGNAYTKVAENAPASGGYWVNQIWTAKSTGSNASNVVTINKTNGTNASARAAVYTGMNDAVQLTAHGEAAQDATSVTSGSFNPTAGHMAFAVVSNGSTFNEISAGTNYTERAEIANNEWLNIEDRLGLSAGSQTASGTCSTAQSWLNILVATFRPSGTDRTESGATGAAFTLAGNLQADRFLGGALAGSFALAGSPQHDANLSGLVSSVFTVGGGPILVGGELDLSGAVGLGFTVRGEYDYSRTPVLDVWGLPVDWYHTYSDVVYLGLYQGGRIVPAPPPQGNPNKEIVTVNPRLLQFLLQGNPLLDLSTTTKFIDGTLRAMGFLLAGGPVLAAKLLSGTLVARFGVSGNPDRILGGAGQENVMDFGAVGDGVHDDTAAFQAATNTGNTVFVPIPPNFYRITSPIRLRNSIYGDMSAHGADGSGLPFIRMDEADNGSGLHLSFLVTGYKEATRLEIAGLRIDNRYVNRQNGGEFNHNIAIHDSNNVRVTTCRLENADGDAVCVGEWKLVNDGRAPAINCRNIVVDNNYIYNPMRCGMSGIASDQGCRLTRCYVRKINALDNGTFIPAVDLEPEIANVMWHTEIDNNVFNTRASNGTYVSICWQVTSASSNPNPVTDTLVKNNTGDWPDPLVPQTGGNLALRAGSTGNTHNAGATWTMLDYDPNLPPAP